MTFLYWSAVYLYGFLIVRSDTDWRAIPYLLVFMAALALAMVDMFPVPADPLNGVDPQGGAV